MIFYRILRRTFTLVRRSCNNLRCFCRYKLLKFQAFMVGGNLQIGLGCQLNQRIVFQGEGYFQLDDNVRLGYELGGSPSLPILIQPRKKISIISIGKRSRLANGCELIALRRITIGEDCLVGAKCVIIDADFHSLQPKNRTGEGRIIPVTIGNRVWIGFGVTILKGVTIGDDAVVGAGSVVTRDIPAGGIAVGNPAKVIGSVYDA